MADWVEISRSSLNAAASLASEHPRSSVSRSYYAAYAAATAVLHRAKMKMPVDRESPPHHGLGSRLSDGLGKGASVSRAREVRKYMSVLYKYRLAADYSARETVDGRTARDALRLAGALLRRCEVQW